MRLVTLLNGWSVERSGALARVAKGGAGIALAVENAAGMGNATRKTTDYLAPAPARAADTVSEPRRCDGCGRVPLIGESVAHYKSGAVRCDLCRSLHHREQPISEALVKHAPDGPHSRVRVIRRLPS